MIPINTTTITVLRLVTAEDADPADAEGSPSIIAEGVRAVIASPSGHERNINGQQQVVEFALSCDPCELTNLDRVVDDTTGEIYEVAWVTQKLGLDLDHTRAGLRSVKGVSPSNAALLQ